MARAARAPESNNSSNGISSVGREPSILEPGGPSSRLEHDRVIPRAISPDAAGFVYINPAPASPSSHLPLSHLNETYYSHDLKGISKSARARNSILAARARSSIFKYLGDFERARASWRLVSNTTRDPGPESRVSTQRSLQRRWFRGAGLRARFQCTGDIRDE